jgi:hypothetical protein
MCLFVCLDEALTTFPIRDRVAGADEGFRLWSEDRQKGGSVVSLRCLKQRSHAFPV